MNRRDTLKSIIAGLFCGLLPKKATAKPFNYDECEPDYRKWVEDFHNTQWFTYVKSSPTLGWSSKFLKRTTTVNVTYLPSGKTYPASSDDYCCAVFIQSEPNAPLRQVCGVQVLQDGSRLFKLGFREDEIEANIDEAFSYAKQANEDFQKTGLLVVEDPIMIDNTTPLKIKNHW